MIGKKVYGNGNLFSGIMLVGEGPGQVESESGLPFQGASGAELDFLYLRRAAKLRREDIYTTNIVKWRTDEKDSDPTATDIIRDEADLLAELEVCNPRIIVAVGAVAARYFLGTEDVDMEKFHGVPVSRNICGKDRIVLVCYHPAAGLRAPDRYLDKIYWDFQRLGQLVRGEITVHPPPGAVHYSVEGESNAVG